MIAMMARIFALMLLWSVPAAAQHVGSYTVLGFQQLSSLSSATKLTVPDGANIAVIEVNSGGQSVRWRDDGTAPTASVGTELLPGSQLTYSGNLAAIQFIQTAASATLNVSYYK